MTGRKLGVSDAVIVVDVQRDFCPGGALPVSEGDAVVPVLNHWVSAAEKAGALVVASRDWHPPGHISFTSEGGPWPAHCLRGTEGANFHTDLKLPADALIVSKGEHREFDQYSAFDRTGLGDRLREKGIKRLWVGGLAQDVCVRSTVLDALKEGFEVHVIVDGTRPVNVQPEGGEKAFQEMKAAGAVMEESGDAAGS